MDLLIATKNTGKVREVIDLLAGLPIRLHGLEEFSGITDIEETGATFAANADLKAQTYALESGVWALADDSGLEVEALGGAPGIFSARYAGGKTDSERLRILLSEIEKGDPGERLARFVCAMTLADETGRVRYRAEGICRGTIADAPRGDHGFGYDPVFIPKGFDQTFGELSVSIKREISHRARAIAEIFDFLRDFTAL